MNIKVTGTVDLNIDLGDAPPSPPPLVLPAKAIFPPTDLWNTDISGQPVDANSTLMLKNAGASGVDGLTLGLHPDFGTVWQGVPIGIPYNLVSGTQAKVPVTFRYATESDLGPYPIPPNPKLEAGDAHLLIIDVDSWMLYEMFSYAFDGVTHRAAAGAIWDLTTNTKRPAGWTSADAAGLPIFPGLARYDEVVTKGAINHALRVTVKRTRRDIGAPANHWASTISGTDPGFLPMGARIRLKAAYPLTGFSPPAQTVLTAMKKYGAFVADNGSAFYITGSPDARWNDAELAEIKRVKGSDLEVVKLGALTTG